MIQSCAKPEKTVYKKTIAIVIDAVMIALTLFATMCINIKLPFAANGGLVHLGNVPVLIAAVLFGKKSGAVAGAFGMALFDVLSGAWATWAPFTFVIVGLMGFSVGAVMERGQKHFNLWYVFAIVIALALKIGGYYIAEGLIYRNWIAPLTSIPGNMIQVVVAGIVAYPLILALRKIFQTRGVIQ